MSFAPKYQATLDGLAALRLEGSTKADELAYVRKLRHYWSKLTAEEKAHFNQLEQAKLEGEDDWDKFRCQCGKEVRISKSRKLSMHQLPVCDRYRQIVSQHNARDDGVVVTTEKKKTQASFV